MKKCLVLLLSLLLLATPAFAGESPASITVTGSGSAPVKPDTAILSFTTEFSSQNPAQTDAAVAALRQTLVDTLSQNGINAVYIDELFDVKTILGYQHGKLDGGRSQSGLSVRVDFTMRLSDLDSANAVITAALPVAPDSHYTLSFETSASAAAYHQALAAAVENAREKARLLCESCGLTLGGVTSVRELDAPASSLTDVQAAVEITFQTIPSI